MSERPWPPYRVGNPDYIHAMGVIASVYNLLEFRFRAVFSIYIRPNNLSYMLFAKTTNQMRLEYMQNALAASMHPDSIKGDVGHFLNGFKRCADNRNIFMHSTVAFVFGPGDERCPELTPLGEQPRGVVFQKSPKDDPFRINTYHLSIEQIREQADASKRFEIYGDKLYWHILKNYEPIRYQTWGFPDAAPRALPDRPVLPDLLIPLPPDTPQG
jgi:hypothetical protein